jgi:hypothetical protein
MLEWMQNKKGTGKRLMVTCLYSCLILYHQDDGCGAVQVMSSANRSCSQHVKKIGAYGGGLAVGQMPLTKNTQYSE